MNQVLISLTAVFTNDELVELVRQELSRRLERDIELMSHKWLSRADNLSSGGIQVDFKLPDKDEVPA